MTLTNSLSNNPGKIHKVEDEIINDDQIPQTAQSVPVVSEVKKEKPSLVIGQDGNEEMHGNGNEGQGMFFDYDEYDREDEDEQDSFHHDHMADFLTNLF